MTKEAFRAQYREEMACVRVSARLRRETLDLIAGRESSIVKRKLSFAAVLVILLLLCAAALAAATRFGVLDFTGRYAGVHTPEDARQYLQTDVLHLENELVTADVREVFYDGLTSRMTIDVKARDEAVMLLGEDMTMDDNWQNMLRMDHEWDPDDIRTARDVFIQGGYRSAWTVESRLDVVGERDKGGISDFHLNDDGTLTLYQESFFDGSEKQREIELVLCLIPFDEELEQRDLADRVWLRGTLSLTEAAYDKQIYESTGTCEYPSVGVRVEQLTIEVRAQEIYAFIDFAVTDPERYAVVGDGLWFEFVDSKSTETAPWDQRLPGGLRGAGNIEKLGENRFRQTETLGRDELYAAYTLRAYDAWEKTRFESCEIAVAPVPES